MADQTEIDGWDVAMRNIIAAVEDANESSGQPTVTCKITTPGSRGFSDHAWEASGEIIEADDYTITFEADDDTARDVYRLRKSGIDVALEHQQDNGTWYGHPEPDAVIVESS